MTRQDILEGFVDTTKFVIIATAYFIVLMVCGFRWAIGKQEIHVYDKVGFVVMMVLVIPAWFVLLSVLSTMVMVAMLSTIAAIIGVSFACIPLIRWVNKQ
jgi:hypothetical protein